MKKNLQPARTETKTSKSLFGISSDKLKAVNGGSGVIVHGDNPPPPPSSGT